MVELSGVHKKVLDIYANKGYINAWNYWKLMGLDYGIFLGEVSSGDFIDAESLTKHIKLSEGVLCNNDTPWLKFLLDGNIIYVPMKPIMHSVTWDSINACGAIFENDGATIDIGGDTYDVTLLCGQHPSMSIEEACERNISVYDFSEWNKLFYPIHAGDLDTNIIKRCRDVTFSQWAMYNDDDLITHHHAGNGSGTLTQDIVSHSSFTELRFYRGYGGVTHAGDDKTIPDCKIYGYRPALRLII